MQNALKVQLETELQRQEIEYLNKTKMLSDLENEKEEIGVKLYEKQQNLVELQKNLENLHEEQKMTIREGEQHAKTLTELERELKEKKIESVDLNNQLLKRIEELSKQNLTIKEIENYNKNLNSEIKVKKRVTYKIEEKIADNEKLKDRQDYMIYTLMEEQKRVKQQRDILEAQLKLQKNELIDARTSLKEAEDEISKIIYNKQTLMNHLQKTSLSFNEKNKLLIMVKESLKGETEINTKKVNEIKGLEAEIKKENGLYSRWLTIVDKLEKELEVLEGGKIKIVEKINKAQEKFDLLQKACDTSEDDLSDLKRKETLIKHDMNLIEGNIMKYHTVIKEKNEEVLRLISNHKTKEKLKKNVLKQIKEIELRNQEKLMEIENFENEISRIRLDILNTQNQIISLKESRELMEKERQEKEKTINKYEGIIRENHDAHEKKMHEVAKFNREHDRAKQKMDIISKGPSETTLLQLEKEIVEFRKERKRLEGEFIRSQTRAVNKEILANRLQDEISTLKRKETILEQKNMRLNGQYYNCKKEIKGLEISLKNYEKDMNKLNDFLAEFKEKKESLSNQSNNINSEFIEKLNQLEGESAKLEIEIEKLKTSKAEILENITECERQILLWERKIELEKEMQEALDPNIDKQELQLLKKELHLKTLKLAEIKKNHDKLILEIERVVNKRENINVKYNAKEIYSKMNTKDVFAKKKQAVNLKSQVAKNIQLFKSSIKQSQSNIKNLDKKIDRLSRESNAQKENIEANEEEILNEKEELQEATQFIRDYKIKRVINVLDIFAKQKKAQTLEKIIKRGKAVKAKKLSEATLADKMEKNKKFVEALAKVVQSNGELDYLTPYLDELSGLMQKN